MPASTRSAANRAMKATAGPSSAGTSTFSVEEHPRDVPHVVALIEVRRVVDTLPLKLLPSEVDGPPQGLNLPARVVHVILAHHLIACFLQDIREYVAYGRAPSMTYVERPGGVGAHKLH